MTYPLRMQHPAHGWHNAYNSMEEAQLRSNGWADDHAAPQADEPTTAVAPVSYGKSPDGAAPKRRGRPPKVK
jgi:hypothetical protein